MAGSFRSGFHEIVPAKTPGYATIDPVNSFICETAGFLQFKVGQTIPYCLYYAKDPSPAVRKFVQAAVELSTDDNWEGSHAM